MTDLDLAYQHDLMLHVRAALHLRIAPAGVSTTICMHLLCSLYCYILHLGIRPQSASAIIIAECCTCDCSSCRHS